jgi:UDP-N-acetylglucosamine--N-acetylmuramyl-(pentapeptide) pyrophosphoryl-undecaprenol N-acetylglucosamine transferase
MALKEVDAMHSARFHIGQRPEQSSVTVGPKVLWVSSTGGHLSELWKIEEGVVPSDDSLWVTFDSPQSRAYLKGRRTHFVDYVAPRDLPGALKAARQIAPYLRHERFDMCVSTGAAVAAGILPMAALKGVPTYYIESVARTAAPSLTGKLMSLAPGVRTLAQYKSWSSKKWPYAGSLLDGWSATGTAIEPRPLRILVTLGTIRPYRFDRAVDAVLSILVEGDEVIWQLGSTTRPGLPGAVNAEMSPARITELARTVDVVVAHAGVGSMLHLFENGISPVVAVRSGRFGEHIDEHQLTLAESTAARGLTTILDLAVPSRQALLLAAGRTVSSQVWPPRVTALSC